MNNNKTIYYEVFFDTHGERNIIRRSSAWSNAL